MNDLANIRRPPRYERILSRSRDAEFAMNSDVLTGALLRTLAASKPSGAMLEMGTGCGLGASWILDGMDASSSLVSVDNDRRVQSIAASELGDDARLELVLQDGGAFLERCERQFDLVFADAWPGKYTHFDEALRLLKPGGIYVIDDMLPQPAWPEGHATNVAGLIAGIEQLSGFEVSMLSWSTGVIIVVNR